MIKYGCDEVRASTARKDVLLSDGQISTADAPSNANATNSGPEKEHWHHAHYATQYALWRIRMATRIGTGSYKTGTRGIY